MIYFSYKYSIITYGTILGGNSSTSIKNSELKKIIRIITNTRSRESYRDLFQNMKLPPLCSQYIQAMSLYLVNNKHLYTMNMEIHKFKTRCNNNLHPPISNLTKFQKGVYYSGTKIFIHLPANIKCSMNDLKHFRIALIYTLEEFFNYNR